MSDDLVSVIVPTYNAATHLPECLQSIANQTYEPIEIVVVDNHSTDHTRAIAREFTDQVYTVGPERCAQLNRGFAAASGRYYYRVDADVRLEPEVVEAAVAQCEHGADAVCVHNTSDASVSFWAAIRKFERDFYETDDVNVAARFFERSVIEDVGGFDEDLVAGEDYDLHNRILAAGYTVEHVEPREVHLDEPATLGEVLGKHYDYGKTIRTFIEKNPDRGREQLQVIRPAYRRKWSRFLRNPTLTGGFVLYQLSRYGAAGAGMAVDTVQGTDVVEPILDTIRTGIDNPEKVVSHVDSTLSATGRLLSEGRVREAVGYALSSVGIDVYNDVLERQAEDGLVRRQILGFEMDLFADDSGISRELAAHRIHEPESTRAFAAALRDVANRVDRPVVLEIGGNIGYFALIEASILGPDARIYLAEPVPRNVALCRHNLALNGYEDRVTVSEGAVSETDGEAELFLSDHSNRSRLGDTPVRSASGQTAVVDTWHPRTFLADHDVDPTDLNVIRMDVEGHESTILPALAGIIDEAPHLVLFVEVHRSVLDEGRLPAVLDVLSDLTLRAGHVHGGAIEVDELGNLRQYFDRYDCENVGLVMET